MYGLNTLENLKSYHLGLLHLISNYSVPTVSDLYQEIRSHSQYIGLQPQDTPLEKGKKDPFVIFEGGQSDFYMAHSKGVRHFTIQEAMIGKGGIGKLDNGQHKSYPSFNAFIECTMSS